MKLIDEVDRADRMLLKRIQVLLKLAKVDSTTDDLEIVAGATSVSEVCFKCESKVRHDFAKITTFDDAMLTRSYLETSQLKAFDLACFRIAGMLESFSDVSQVSHCMYVNNDNPNLAIVELRFLTRS